MSASHDKSPRTHRLPAFPVGTHRVGVLPKRRAPLSNVRRRLSGLPRAQLDVTLVDSDPVTRAGIRAIVEDHRDLRVFAELDQLEGALEVTSSGRPRVLLVEAGIAAENRGEALRAVLAAVPHVKAIAFGVGTREEELFQVFDAGAVGYLMRRTLVADLGPALRSIEAGGTYVPPQIGQRLLEREKRQRLTPRESDVLALLAEARSNATIAAVLGISIGTVKLHVRAVLAKLGAEDRVEAAVLAVERGFVRGR